MDIRRFANTFVRRRQPWVACLALSLLLAPVLAQPPAESVRQRFQRPVSVPSPAGNPWTAAKANLGRMLFFDPRLSRDNNIACATCHDPAQGWEDGRALSIGHSGEPLGRHTPTIQNLAWQNALFWDGRTPTLESQVWVPLTLFTEMAQDLRELTEELHAIPEYVDMFEAAFPGQGISLTTISNAIASFERTVITGETPFDRWLAGDEQAVSAAAVRGFGLFTGKAGCESCHQGWNFTDGLFHDTGLPATNDPGRYMFTRNENDRNAFKTPGLRNIALRAPYMHDGSLKSLREVVEHYNGGFIVRPSLSGKMSVLALSEEEVGDLVGFLETLTSQDDIDIPRLPETAGD